MTANVIKVFPWIKLIIKLLLYLIILPFWLIYILVKYWTFKCNFKKQLKLAGLDNEKRKYLANELNFTMPFKEFI